MTTGRVSEPLPASVARRCWPVRRCSHVPYGVQLDAAGVLVFNDMTTSVKVCRGCLLLDYSARLDRRGVKRAWVHDGCARTTRLVPRVDRVRQTKAGESASSGVPAGDHELVEPVVEGVEPGAALERPDPDVLHQLVAAGLTGPEIGRRTSMSRATVYGWLRRYGITADAPVVGRTSWRRRGGPGNRWRRWPGVSGSARRQSVNGS